MNFQSSSEHLCVNLAEINCNSWFFPNPDCRVELITMSAVGALYNKAVPDKLEPGKKANNIYYKVIP